MAKGKTPVDILQLLDKSNCRECGEKTCLAFAGAVFRGQRKISDCPRLDPEIIKQFSDEAEIRKPVDTLQKEYLEKLKDEITRVDLASAAQRVGGRFSGNKLTLKMLGKDFSVDTKGHLYADIHVNPWVTIPFLNHILYGKGLPATGHWLSFRELKNGRERYPLFRKRCEEAMKQVADTHTELFDFMVHVFNGKQVEKQFRSDISVVLYPLPKVPLMVCYWMPDGGLESSLNVFFDETANDNLDIDSTFSLGAGIAQMFEKIASKHGFEDVTGF